MWLLLEGSAGLNAKLCDQRTSQISTSTPKRAQYAPHQRTRPNYVETKQLATLLDTSLPIPEGRKRRIQKIIGTFLYYDPDMDCIMLPALNKLADQQSSPTKNAEAAITNFLDYAATNQYAIIQYKARYMILHISSDASYLSNTRACSCTGWHYYLISLPTDLKKSPNLPPPANGPIHTEWRILKHAVASTAKEEVGGLFQNGQT